MSKVVIDMTVSLDGFVAGRDDGRQYPLGRNDGFGIFDWYTSGTDPVDSKPFKPRPGANREIVEEVLEDSGAFDSGRRTCDITNSCDGRHPAFGVQVFVLTHRPPPADQVPSGPSNLTFVTDGIASDKAKAVANGKEIKLGGASPGQHAIAAGLCDEIMLHISPFLIGGGVPLLEGFDGPIRLEKPSSRGGPLATLQRYRVIK